MDGKASHSYKSTYPQFNGMMNKEAVGEPVMEGASKWGSSEYQEAAASEDPSFRDIPLTSEADDAGSFLREYALLGVADDFQMLCALSDIDPTAEGPRGVGPANEDHTDETPQTAEPTRIIKRLATVVLPDDHELQGTATSQPPAARADDEAPQGCGAEVGASSLQEAGEHTVPDGCSGGGTEPESAGSDSGGAACAAACPPGVSDAGKLGCQALAGAPCQWLRLRPKTSAGPLGGTAVVTTEGKEGEEDGKRAKKPMAKLVLQNLLDYVHVLPAVKDTAAETTQAPKETAKAGRPPLNRNSAADTRTLFQEAHEDVQQVARPRTASNRAQSQRGCGSARGRRVRVATAGMQEICFGVLPTA